MSIDLERNNNFLNVGNPVELENTNQPPARNHSSRNNVKTMAIPSSAKRRLPAVSLHRQTDNPPSSIFSSSFADSQEWHDDEVICQAEIKAWFVFSLDFIPPKLPPFSGSQQFATQASSSSWGFPGMLNRPVSHKSGAWLFIMLSVSLFRSSRKRS